MDDIRIGWRVSTRKKGDGEVISIRLLPKGHLIGVKHDDGRISHHYKKNLQPAKSGANTTYADIDAKAGTA
jgi:hypothetical protein